MTAAGDKAAMQSCWPSRKDTKGPYRWAIFAMSSCICMLNVCIIPRMGKPHGPGGRFDTSRKFRVNLVSKMIASNPAAATPTEKPCQNTSKTWAIFAMSSCFLEVRSAGVTQLQDSVVKHAFLMTITNSEEFWFQSELCWCFTVVFLMQHKFCSVNLVRRSWRTWMPNRIAPTYCTLLRVHKTLWLTEHHY